MISWFKGKGSTKNWKSAGCTNVGRVRDLNEDAFLNMPHRQLWAVADGMGGHQSGDVASKSIVEALTKASASENINEVSGLIAGALTSTNANLRALANSKGGEVIIGATIVAAVARGDRLAIMWAGDSRAYRLRDNYLEQITCDHDLVSEMREQSAPKELLRAAELKGNMITRAVGAHEKLMLDEIRLVVQPGDVYLLCSDGLYRESSDQEIKITLQIGDAERAANSLVDGAVASGGHDNITAVVLMVGND